MRPLIKDIRSINCISIFIGSNDRGYLNNTSNVNRAILSRLLIFVHFATTNNIETAKDRKDVFNISVKVMKAIKLRDAIYHLICQKNIFVMK